MYDLWKSLSRKEAIERSKPVLDSIPFVPRPESEETKDSNFSGVVPEAKPKQVCNACAELGLSLTRTQHRIMEAICENPDEEIRDRCDRLRITRETESSDRRALMTFGLIRCVGSAGNRRLFFSPTENKGERWREAHGLPRCSEHGGPIHTFVVTKSEKKLSLARPGTKFVRRRTGEPGGVRPDSLALPPGATGRRIALQAAVGHQPKGEAVNLLKLCGVRKEAENRNTAEWIDLVVSIGVNKQVQNSIERAVRDLNNGQVPLNLVFFNVEEHVIDPSFDWSVLLEREI
jgi:DNA-binding MarR family transcriptional regulator